MNETPRERVLPEQQFIAILGEHVCTLDQLSNALLAHEAEGEGWSKRHYFQIFSETEALESFLDDYGARYNRTYHVLTEFIASTRGLAMAGFSLRHLGGRIEGYGVQPSFRGEDQCAMRMDLDRALAFVRRSLFTLLRSIQGELTSLGVRLGEECFPSDRYERPGPRMRLPRNMGQEDPLGEEQRIAEVATKFLQACAMLEELGLERIAGPLPREAFLRNHASEEHCRVYEATVHNLQSTYDTFIKNTVIEARDERLPRLRGHMSITLHLLEVATLLMHFVERHESEERSPEAARRLAELVDPTGVHDVTLNILLYWSDRVMHEGRELAEELLPTYIDLQELEVQLDADITLHARPASLIVGIVNHHGTPVEMEVEGSICNAGSILELMIAVGSNPDARQFRFRGDARPLADIQSLFECGLGERGLDGLPADLDYLRS